MTHYLPHNLNINDHLLNHPPVNIKRFKKAHLTYILSLISEIPANNKHLKIFDLGYVPLNAQRLQSKIHNYNQYLQYLVDTDILEGNLQYIPGKRSRSYRYSEKYLVSITPPPIKSLFTIPNETLLNQCQYGELQKYSYLTSWFNTKLKIDHYGAFQFIRKNEENKPPEVNRRRSIRKSNASIINITRLATNDYRLSVDNNVHRFHSNLTNLKGELRNFLKYDNEKLVSIDITNSQPYLSTVLLSERFYSTKHFNIDSGSINIESFLDKLHYKLFTRKNKGLEQKNIKSIQKLLFNHGEVPKDILLYIELVSNGTFYEFLQMNFAEKLGLRYANRKSAKSAIFTLLFTGNRFIGQRGAKSKRIFKDIFPSVYRIFSEIKKNDHTLLPRLLQIIESHLVLDRICKRISIEYPWLPIFTIHDSIATTVGAEEHVSKIITEELFLAIGITPKLKIEYWDPSQLSSTDSILNFTPTNMHTNIIG